MNKIDIHHHYVPDFYNTELKDDANDPSRPMNPTTESSLAFMDRRGISKAYLSPATFCMNFRDEKEELSFANRSNRYASKLKERYPDRYGAFACLPFSNPEASYQEFLFSTDKLNLDGAVIYPDTYAALPEMGRYRKLFREWNRRRSVVFIHPAGTSKKAIGNLSAYHDLLDPRYEIARFITLLHYEGLLERYPGIRFILSYGGGNVPFLAQRIGRVFYLKGKKLHWGKILGDLLRGRNRGVEILSRLYYDCSAAMDPCSLASLLELTDSKRILFGSDFGEKNRTGLSPVPHEIPGLHAHNAKLLFSNTTASPW